MGNSLARCTGSTIYATVLEALKIPTRPMISFELRDGRLSFHGRYHSGLASSSVASRSRAKKLIARNRGPIRPSNMGAHSKLLMTVRETANFLELRTSVRYNGTEVDFDLTQTIPAYFALERTEACTHPPSSTFDAPPNSIFLTTVKSPPSQKLDSIAVSMTLGNPTAQLLCCEPGVKAILMQDCCLDCAIEQAKQGDFKLIIVS